MPSSLYINGTDRTSDLVRESVRITRESSYRNSAMTFRLRQLSALPEETDVIEFYDDQGLNFTGMVGTVEHNSPVPELSSSVNCLDWYDALLGQLVRKTYTANTLGEIIQNIVAERVLESDLKCMLQFEEGTGDALDSTTYENPAILTGAGATWDTVNYAVDVTGAAGSYVKIVDSADIDFTSDFSVCIEVKLDVLNQTILQKEGGANRPYKIAVDASGYVVFSVTDSGGTEYTLTQTAGTALGTSAAQSIVCTYNTSSGLGNIYVDGALVKSGALTTSALLNSTGDLVIGASSGTSYDGKVYRISLYSRTLAAIEARRWDLDFLEVKAPLRLISSASLSMPTEAFAYMWPADCLTQMCTEASLAWRIDEYMQIRVYDLASGTPVMTISESDGASVKEGTVVVKIDRTQVRNVVYVRGGEYAGAWQMDTLEANGSNTVFPLPYKYTGFELFTDTIAQCGYIKSWWKMNDASGSLVDAFGNNTLDSVAALTYSATGQLGDAITYDGSTSKSRKVTGSHVTGDTAHSMSIWAKATTVDTTERYLIGFGDFAGERSTLSLIVVSSIAYLRHRFDGSAITDVAIGDVTGAWHLFGMSYDPATNALRLYVDGVAVYDESVSDAAISAGAVEIGGNNASNVFDGDIDEAFLFNYSLATQEHLALYLMGDAGQSAALLNSGVEFLNEAGSYDGLYNYAEKNYRFTSAPADGVLFYTSGQPELPVQAVKADNNSILRYGRREFEISDETYKDLSSARKRAAAELSRRRNPPVSIRFESLRAGMSAGAIIEVTLPSFDLPTGRYFVQRLETRYFLSTEQDSIQHAYSVEAVNVLSKDWIDFLRDSFLQKRRPIDPKETETIGDLIAHSEDMTLDDSHVIATPISHGEDLDLSDSHALVEVTSGGYKWSNDAGTTPDKLRWNLGDWG